MTIQNLVEELASEKQITIYHVSRDANLGRILANDDFTPGIFGSGYMHGKGFYTVWKKEDLSIKRYGRFIYKGVINFKKNKILILDPDFFKELKIKITQNFIEEQLRKAIPNLDKKFLPEFKNGNIEYKGKSVAADNFNSSDFLSSLRKVIPHLERYFDGVAYRGERDGHCILMWNFREVKILGRYNPKDKKTKIDIENYKKQKKSFFYDHTIYNENGIKLVEQNKKYILTDKRKVVSLLSRELRDSVFIGDQINAFIKSLKKYKIPEEIVKSLTLSNGINVLNKHSVIKTFEKRTGRKMNFSVETIQNDIDKGIFVKKLNGILKSTFKSTFKPFGSPFSRHEGYKQAVYEYFNELYIEDENDRKKLEKVNKLLEKDKLIVYEIQDLPEFLEKNKNTFFECGSGNLENSFQIGEAKKVFEIFGDRLINVPKKMRMSLYQALKMFRDKSKVDLTKQVGNCKLILKQTGYNNGGNSLLKIKKFVNCVLINPEFSNFRSDVLPPCIFDSNFIRGAEKESNFIPPCSSIDFGNSEKTWIFPSNFKEIEYPKNLSRVSLHILEKRNPKIKFIKREKNE